MVDIVATPDRFIRTGSLKLGDGEKTLCPPARAVTVAGDFDEVKNLVGRDFLKARLFRMNVSRLIVSLLTVSRSPGPTCVCLDPASGPA
jgi:hypothetical protein